MYYWVAANASGKGDYLQAIKAIHQAVEIENSVLLQAELGYAYGRKGDRQKALEVLVKLDAMSKERYVQPYNVARVHAALGQKDEAFQCLEHAVIDRCEELMHAYFGGLMLDPAWDGLRDDPRFFELRKKVGLDVWPRPTRTIPKELIGLTHR